MRKSRRPKTIKDFLVGLEKDALKAILDYLEYAPGKYYRQNSGVAKYQNKDGSWRRISYGIPGASDITGAFIDGRRVEIEVKRDGEWLSDEQLLFMWEMAQLGVICIIAYDQGDVERAFKYHFAEIYKERKL